MLHRLPRPTLACALALAFASTGCGEPKEAWEPIHDPSAPRAQTEKQAPAAPPGHLMRADVDRILTTQGPPWLLRRVMREEVLRPDGKFTGWRLTGLPDEWAAIDLRPGDVVTRVNGISLETPDDAWEAWKSVAKADRLKITLTRDGVGRELVLPIDGAPTPETTKMLGRDAAPARVNAPPRAVQIGAGPAPDEPEDESY